MNTLASLQAVVHGHVQGVFFRAFASNQASQLGLTGFVRNLPDGTVEVYAEGDVNVLERFINDLEIGPPGAGVERIVVKWLKYTGSFINFSIRH